MAIKGGSLHGTQESRLTPQSRARSAQGVLAKPELRAEPEKRRDESGERVR